MEFIAGMILGALLAGLGYELGLRRGETIVNNSYPRDTGRNYYD